jgi:hypothetical protein
MLNKHAHLTVKQIEDAFKSQPKQTRVFDRFVWELANKRQRKYFYEVTNIQLEGRLLLSLGYASLSEMFYYSNVLYLNPPVGDIGMTLNKR